MPRVGVVDLPLHQGTAPRWLFGRMVKLSRGIIEVLVDEFGRSEFLQRISDPFWFQAFSCVLGFDWHSSGTTTVTCGAVKEALRDQNLGLFVAGGKGRTSRRTPLEIERITEKLKISEEIRENLIYCSRMSAKVDSAAIQDQHTLYHHSLFFTLEGEWSVVQQGLNVESGYARRYHWSSRHVKSFVDEPHDAIIGKRMQKALDMTSSSSEACRKTSLDIIKDNPRKLFQLIKSVRHPKQRTLSEWTGEEEPVLILSMPRNINWETAKRVYDWQPQSYEELLSIKGVGPRTIRALALISELIYGSKPSWKDPVKYTFTVGGKDGVPYPVDKRTMDRTTEILRRGVEEAKLGKKERIRALQRLRNFLPGESIGPA
ncbi:MAG: DUF763 domain-containing protein, partial [Thermoplasmata archaeon]